MLGIVLGVLGTFAAVEISGGWYVYEIWPERDCRTGGPTLIVPEPVTGSGTPCMFRRPRWSLIN